MTLYDIVWLCLFLEVCSETSMIFMHFLDVWMWRWFLSSNSYRFSVLCSALQAEVEVEVEAQIRWRQGAKRWQWCTLEHWTSELEGQQKLPKFINLHWFTVLHWYLYIQWLWDVCLDECLSCLWIRCLQYWDDCFDIYVFCDGPPCGKLTIRNSVQ